MSEGKQQGKQQGKQRRPVQPGDRSWHLQPENQNQPPTTTPVSPHTRDNQVASRLPEGEEPEIDTGTKLSDPVVPDPSEDSGGGEQPAEQKPGKFDAFTHTCPNRWPGQGSENPVATESPVGWRRRVDSRE